MHDRVTNDSLGRLRRNVMPEGLTSVAPIYVESASGALLRDVEGNEYIDFSGGIAVMNVGHSHPKVVAAIKDQAEKLTHTCFMVLPYEPAVRLAERLCAVTPGSFSKRALFANSGAEAVENAVKIARYFTGRPAVIAFEYAFHGRTLLGMTLTSKVKPYKLRFGPFAPEIYRAPYPYCYRCHFNLEYPSCDVACADYLEEFFVSHVAPESTAAIIMEPVAGEGGFIAPPEEYFSKLANICSKHEILFIADEIQSGMGRTGTMFAMEHWGVVPDLITIAKSLAAGMPLSAVVGKAEIMDSVHASGVGGTFGGNPVACRAALAVLDIFEEEDLLQRAVALGHRVKEQFQSWQQEFEFIGDVRGIGAMMALELVKDRKTKEPAADEAKALVRYCYEKGLIILVCGSFNNVIRAPMPLVIKDEQLDKGLSIMYDGLRSLVG
jgi:4-aminobutyrate aminotransferase/(S)-3-amino-2-methylpropionate transaminase